MRAVAARRRLELPRRLTARFTPLHAVACADAAPGINRSARFTYRAKGADPTPRTLSLYVEPDELLDGVKAAFGIPATCDFRF